MKDFNSDEYAAMYMKDMEAKIPGYSLMFDLIFHGVLPVEAKEVHSILSIGGGLVEVMKSYDAYKDASFTLVDPSENMIGKIQEELEEYNISEYVEFKCSSFETYENERCFDLCLSLLVIHFVSDKEQFLRNIYNSLEADGFCVLSAFSDYHLDWWETYAIHNGANAEQVGNTRKNPQSTMACTSADEIEMIANNTGFHSIEKIAQILSVDVWILRK